MEPATSYPQPNSIASFLAGLQAGMVAAFWMLIWLGISSMWMRHSFWAPMNTMATVFFRDGAIRPGFGSTTPSGIALYLMIYSLLGAIFVMIVRQRLTRLGVLLASILFSVIWYWIWFRAVAIRTMPLLWLLHPERSTEFGHVIFGALLARYSDYLPARPRPPLPEPVVHSEAAD
jgi:hypothetical protein